MIAAGHSSLQLDDPIGTFEELAVVASHDRKLLERADRVIQLE